MPWWSYRHQIGRITELTHECTGGCEVAKFKGL